MKGLKHLPVPGLSNCRDLGGFAAENGMTRYGVFLRSEAPCGIPEAGIDWLRDYGKRSICAVKRKSAGVPAVWPR